jgi:hypothetical protein
VRELLASSQSLVLASRWESGPIVAFEALSQGTTLIGPEWVPSVRDFCSEGSYGTLFRRRSAAALSTAIMTEMTAWQQKARDPIATVGRFRSRFSATAVCQTMLHGMVAQGAGGAQQRGLSGLE